MRSVAPAIVAIARTLQLDIGMESRKRFVFLIFFTNESNFGERFDSEYWALPLNGGYSSNL